MSLQRTQASGDISQELLWELFQELAEGDILGIYEEKFSLMPNFVGFLQGIGGVLGNGRKNCTAMPIFFENSGQ